MKFCQNCGSQVADDAYICPNCGCLTEKESNNNNNNNNFGNNNNNGPTYNNNAPTNYNNNAPANNNNAGAPAGNRTTTLQLVAKIFMIISCVVMGIWLIPLCWTIPMTLSYSRKCANGEPVSVGFKVCTLLFVNLIAGIIMLCDSNN